MKRASSAARSIRGFSIIEIMIGTAVLGVVLTYAMTMNQQGEDQTAGRTAADGLASFQQVAAQYFISNRTELELAMEDGTAASTWCLVNVNADGTGGTQANSSTKKTCAFDSTLLRKKKLWPAGLPVDAVGGGRYVAILRKIYDAGTATGGVDMLVVVAQPNGTLTAVTGDKRRNEQMVSSMSSMGGTGGMVPVGDMVACKATRSTAIYEVCGNGWKVNLSDYIDSSQLTTFANALPD